MNQRNNSLACYRRFFSLSWCNLANKSLERVTSRSHFETSLLTPKPRMETVGLAHACVEMESLYKGILPHLYFSVFLLFCCHSLGSLLMFRTHRERHSIFHMLMCFWSAIYGLLFFLVYIEVSPENSHKLYYTCWFVGFSSYLSYINLIKWYLKLDGLFFLGCRNVLRLVTALYFFEVCSVWLFDHSFFMNRLAEDCTPPHFFRAVNIACGPTMMGMLVGLAGALVISASALFILRTLVRKHREERLLKIGIVLSMCTGMNDILLGLNIFPWTFAVVYFGNAFEAVRFTNYYQELLFKKIGLLRDELSKVAKLAQIGFVASSINHDIMNPLSAIQGSAELLEAHFKKLPSGQDSVVIKNFRRIFRGVKRTREVVESYSALVRHDALWQNGVDAIPFTSLREIFADAVELACLRKPHSGVEVRTELEGNWFIEANLSDMSLAITNLLNNSFDAIRGQSQPWVRIHTQETRRELLIRVTDSGSGITPALQQRIFEVQFTTKPKWEGSGLGLAIVKEIVSRYGFDLSLDSAHPNTQFVISIPKRHARLEKQC